MNALFIATEDFRPRNSGLRIRDWHSWKAVTALAETDVLTYESESAVGSVSFTDGSRIRRRRGSTESAIRSIVGRSSFHLERFPFDDLEAMMRLNTYDFIFASMLYAAAAAARTQSTRGSSRPILIWDTHNFDPTVVEEIARSASPSRRAAAILGRPAIDAAIRDAMRGTDLMFACTDADRDLWRHFGFDGPIVVVPNGADTQSWGALRRVPSNPSVFALYGSLRQDSTARGAIWFLRRVWGPFVVKCPEARLIVAGRSPTRELVREAARASSVVLVADPPSITEVVGSAATFVYPQIWGTGSKIKVVEGVVSGRQLVLSPAATVGLSERDLVGAMIAASPDEWILALSKCSTPATVPDKAGESRMLPAHRYSWRASQTAAMRAIAQAVEARGERTSKPM